MTLNKVLGYTLEKALEEIRNLGLPEPTVQYTLAPVRREAITREGLTPRVIGVKENTLVVSCFKDATPGVREE